MCTVLSQVVAKHDDRERQEDHSEREREPHCGQEAVHEFGTGEGDQATADEQVPPTWAFGVHAVGDSRSVVVGVG